MGKARVSGFGFRVSGAALLLCLLCAPRVYAWWSGGHKLIALAAVARLPDDVPAFFRNAGDELAEMAVEPDKWKDRAAPHLYDTERGEHYIDLENLGGAKLPAKRSEFVKLCLSKNVDPYQNGAVPYAIADGYERLLLAFRTCRAHPDLKPAQERCILYAGWLAHYAGDVNQPLHTTRDFDGRAGGQQKGIHAKIDGYPEKHGFKIEDLGEGLQPAVLTDVWPAILKALDASHSHVDECYTLDAAGAFDTAPEKGRPLMLERTRAATQLTLDLWYSAWKNSETLQEPQHNAN